MPTLVPSSAVIPSPLLPALTFSAVELRGLIQAGVKTAIEDLQRRAGGELNLIQIVRAEQATWRDSSLGCLELDRLYAQVLTPGIWLILSYQGQKFDYRIAGVQARLCDGRLQANPLERQALPGMWARLSSLPTPRSEVAAAELNGKLYVFGGFGPGATANEEYDPSTDTWRRRAPIPQGVDHAAAVAVGGKIYLIGGFEGRFRPVKTNWAYDPETDSWTRKADLPTARGALGAAVLSGKIYAIGGAGVAGDVGTVEEYDPATDTWRPRASMPSPRDHIAIAVVGGKLYVIGGRLGSFARNLGNNEEYDPKADRWVKKAQLPTPRSGIAAAVVDGNIYVFGGEATEGTFNTSERYEPGTDTWKAAPLLPTARHGLGAIALGNRIYVLAGGPTPGGSQSSLNEVFIVLSGTGP